MTSSDSTTVVRRRIVVSGRVQGVAFRHHCVQTATRLGLGGWVRNLADGTVEVAAEGPADDVDELIEWCRRGPTHAHVVGVHTSDEAVVGDEHFTVLG